MNYFIWLIAAALTSLNISGCGNKESTPGISGPLRGADAIRMGETGSTFIGQCQPIQVDGKTYYSRSRFSFASDKSAEQGIPPYTEQIELYETKKCNTVIMTTLAQGDYGFNSDGSRALISFRNFLVIPQTEAHARTLNDKSYCGIIDWIATNGREISQEGSCWPTVKEASYLIHLDDSAGNQVEIYACPNENTSVPSADCMKINTSRAD